MGDGNTSLTSMALEMLPGVAKKKGMKADPMQKADEARGLLKEALAAAKGGLKDSIQEVIDFIDNEILAAEEDSEESEDEMDKMDEEEM